MCYLGGGGVILLLLALLFNAFVCAIVPLIAPLTNPNDTIATMEMNFGLSLVCCIVGIILSFCSV